MKKLHLALTTFLGTALAFNAAVARDNDLVSETRELGTFNKIVLKGSADVNVVVGEAQSVEVRTESEYLDRVETEVRGNILYISQEGRRWRSVDVTLEISVEDLNGVTIKGSGDFDITNLDSESFEIIIKGSGDVDVSGQAASFNVYIQGSGDIDLSGGCGSMDVEVEGSGDVDASNLTCENVDLTLDGSGDIDVYASKSLIANMEGSGDVTIYGNPDRFRPKMKGSGSIDFVDEN